MFDAAGSRLEASGLAMLQATLRRAFRRGRPESGRLTPFQPSSLERRGPGVAALRALSVVRKMWLASDIPLSASEKRIIFRT